MCQLKLMLVLCLGRCLLPKPALPQVLHLVSRIFAIQICSNLIPPLTSCGCRESKTHTRTCHCPSLCVQVPNSDYCNLPCGQNLLFPQSIDPYLSVSDSLHSQLAFRLVWSLQAFILLDLFCFARDTSQQGIVRIAVPPRCSQPLAPQKVAGKLHWNSESDSPTEVLRNRCKMMQSCKIKLTQSRKLKSLRAVPRYAKSSRELSSLGTH